MLHAMSLKGGSRTSTNCVHVSWQLGTNWISALLIRQSVSGAGVFVRVLKWKADTLNTNWTSSLECCCWLQQHSLPDISAKFYQFLFVRRLYSKNQGGPVITRHRVYTYTHSTETKLFYHIHPLKYILTEAQCLAVDISASNVHSEFIPTANFAGKQLLPLENIWLRVAIITCANLARSYVHNRTHILESS